MKTNNLGIFTTPNGKQYTVLEFTKQDTRHPLNGQPVTFDGIKSFETACGVPVNFKNGSYYTWHNELLTLVNSNNNQ